LCKSYNLPAKKTHTQLASLLASLLEVSIYVNMLCLKFISFASEFATMHELHCSFKFRIWKEVTVFFYTGISSCCFDYPISNCERNSHMYVQKPLYVKLRWRIAYVCTMIYCASFFLSERWCCMNNWQPN
jgi:hypothetical protein